MGAESKKTKVMLGVCWIGQMVVAVLMTEEDRNHEKLPPSMKFEILARIRRKIENLERYYKDLEDTF